MFGSIVRDVEQHEISAYIKRAKSKTPGLSSLKIEFLLKLHPLIADLIIKLVNCMIKWQVAPQLLLKMVICNIPKKAGGLRALGLMDEIIKLADYVIISRMNSVDHALQIDVNFGINNMAYVKYHTTGDVINIKKIKYERIRRIGELTYVVNFMLDLKGWFDCINWDILELNARAKNVPEAVLRWWRYLAEKCELSFITETGLTRFVKPRQGTIQGGQASAAKSRYAQTLFQSIISTLILNNDPVCKRNPKECENLIFFADDGELFIQFFQLKEVVRFVFEYSCYFCMSIATKKVKFYAFHTDIIGETITLYTYNWTTGEIDEENYTILDGRECSEKVLGIFVSMDSIDYVIDKTIKVHNSIRWKKPQLDELRINIQAFAIPHPVYFNMTYYWTFDDLICLDKHLTDVIRTTIKAASTTPSDGFYVRRSRGGLGLTCHSIECITALMTEMTCVLNSCKIVTNTILDEIDSLRNSELVKIRDHYLTLNFVKLAKLGFFFGDPRSLIGTNMICVLAKEMNFCNFPNFNVENSDKFLFITIVSPLWKHIREKIPMISISALKIHHSINSVHFRLVS